MICLHCEHYAKLNKEYGYCQLKLPDPYEDFISVEPERWDSTCNRMITKPSIIQKIIGALRGKRKIDRERRKYLIWFLKDILIIILAIIIICAIFYFPVTWLHDLIVK
jgi:hypothetical protein